MDLEQRLLKIEKANRRLKQIIFGAVILFLTATLMAAHQEDAPPKTIIAKEFHLVDPQGNIAGFFGFANGKPTIVLKRGTGGIRLIADEEHAAIEIVKGKSLIEAHNDGCPFFAMKGKDEKRQIAITTGTRPFDDEQILQLGPDRKARKIFRLRIIKEPTIAISNGRYHVNLAIQDSTHFSHRFDLRRFDVRELRQDGSVERGVTLGPE